MEDRLAVIPLDGGLALAVVDGAGGAGGGLEAAEKATRMATEALTSGADLVATLHRIDDALWHDGSCGEATAVVIRIQGDSLLGASVGDSGAMLVSAGAVVDLTSFQRRKPRLGTGYAAPVPFSHQLTEPGTLLAATDGLWPYLAAEKIERLARLDDLDAALEQMVEAVRLPLSRDLPDDVALVMARR